MKSTGETKYSELLTAGDSLAVFLRNMRKFEEEFCTKMMSGGDFTIRLEIRGDKSKLVHCRVNADEFDRPVGAKSRKMKTV